MKDKDIYHYLQDHPESERIYLEWEEYEQWRNICKEEFFVKRREKGVKIANFVKNKSRNYVRTNNRECYKYSDTASVKSKSSMDIRESDKWKGNKQNNRISSSGKETNDLK